MSETLADTIRGAERRARWKRFAEVYARLEAVEQSGVPISECALDAIDSVLALAGHPERSPEVAPVHELVHVGLELARRNPALYAAWLAGGRTALEGIA